MNNIIDMSYMFWSCNSLFSLTNDNRVNPYFKIIIINMSKMFSGCSSLISLPDISIWNTSNVVYMDNMFSGCSSLISLPDLST